MAAAVIHENTARMKNRIKEYRIESLQTGLTEALLTSKMGDNLMRLILEQL
jgi:hypothetical protein